MEKNCRHDSLDVCGPREDWDSWEPDGRLIRVGVRCDVWSTDVLLSGVPDVGHKVVVKSQGVLIVEAVTWVEDGGVVLLLKRGA